MFWSIGQKWRKISIFKQLKLSIHLMFCRSKKKRQLSNVMHASGTTTIKISIFKNWKCHQASIHPTMLCISHNKIRASSSSHAKRELSLETNTSKDLFRSHSKFQDYFFIFVFLLSFKCRDCRLTIFWCVFALQKKLLPNCQSREKNLYHYIVYKLVFVALFINQVYPFICILLLSVLTSNLNRPFMIV
jgi:hypothetical protein